MFSTKLRFAHILFSLSTITAVPSSALAYEFRFGAAFGDEKTTFATTFLKSPHLQDTRITVVPLKSRVEVANSLLAGSIDVGMVSTEAILLSDAKEKPTLAPLMGSPLQFSSEDELLKIQQSVVREAIFTDVGRSGILPMEFWSGGQTQLVSAKPIANLESLKGLKIATLPFGSGIDFVKNLGAEPVTVSFVDVGPSLRKGDADAAELSPQQLTKFLQTGDPIVGGTIIRGFRPLVGFLALSNRYYLNTTEAHRSAIRAAADQAKQASQKDAIASDETSQNLAKKQGYGIVTPDKFNILAVKIAADEAYIARQADRKSAEQQIAEYTEWIRLAKGLDEKKK